MKTVCPSCNAPLDLVSTAPGNDITVDALCCHKCGYALSDGESGIPKNEPVGGSDSVPVSIAETHIGQPAGNRRKGDELEVTYVPRKPVPTDRVAHFRLIRVLGEGSFGAVWLAEDTNLGRMVALKMPNRADRDPRLLHEAQTAAKLAHPNIVSVFEVGEEDANDQVFIASEFIDGRTLRDELQEARPKPERAVEVMAIVAEAAHYAHENEVVHRDMKPANVMIDLAGKPYITDFGIAKSVSEEATISLDGEVVGTIAYMAPEQASGDNKRTDGRADIYAMGVMLFELLTESRPFRGSPQGILYQKGTEDAPSPRTLVPTLDRDLETICLKCLEREPEKRYQTAMQLADELRRFQQNIPILARPVSSIEKAWRWCRRNPGVAGAVTFAFSTLVIALLVVSQFWQRAVDSGEKTRATLYRARMTVAVSRLLSSDVVGLQQVLEQYENVNGESDLRDFAWYHYKDVVAPFSQVVNHGVRVDDVAVSHTGHAFATAGDQHIRCWNTKTGELLREIRSGGYQFSCIDFSPADDRLLSGSSDGVLRVWNPLNHGRVAFELNHGAAVASARFSPNRKHIASASGDGIVKLWTVAGAELVTDSFSVADQPVMDLQFSDDSQFLAVLRSRASKGGKSIQRRIQIWDVDSQALVSETADTPTLVSISFSESGQSICAVGQNGNFLQFSTSDGAVIKQQKPSQRAYGAIARLPGRDNAWYTTALGGQMHIMPAKGQEQRLMWTHANSFGHVACAADGSFCVIGSGDGTAKVLTTDATFRRDIYWDGGVVRDVEFTRDSQSVMMACEDGSVRSWNIGDGTAAEVAPAVGKPAISLAVNPVTGAVAVCGMMRELRVADPAALTVIAETRLPFGGYSSVAYSHNGSMLAVGGRAGNVLLFAADDLSEPRFEYARQGSAVTDICFSVDGAFLTVAWDDRTIQQLDVNSGDVAGELPSTEDTPLSLALCPDGDCLVVGTQGGYLHFYSMDDGHRTADLKAHSGLISSVTVFPGGRLLASGGQDGEIRIWDIATREIVTVLSTAPQSSRYFGITVAPDGKTVASAGVRGDVRVWRTLGYQNLAEPVLTNSGQ
jgi:eukaryotic-like serine/threonine-protein kinase